GAPGRWTGGKLHLSFPQPISQGTLTPNISASSTLRQSGIVVRPRSQRLTVAGSIPSRSASPACVSDCSLRSSAIRLLGTGGTVPDHGVQCKGQNQSSTQGRLVRAVLVRCSQLGIGSDFGKSYCIHRKVPGSMWLGRKVLGVS